MQPEHVEQIRDEKIDFPSAANGRVKALRRLFKWAKKTKKVSANPAAEVEFPDRRRWLAHLDRRRGPAVPRALADRHKGATGTGSAALHGRAPLRRRAARPANGARASRR
jgi:hypothetical protein